MMQQLILYLGFLFLIIMTTTLQCSQFVQETMKSFLKLISMLLFKLVHVLKYKTGKRKPMTVDFALRMMDYRLMLQILTK